MFLFIGTRYGYAVSLECPISWRVIRLEGARQGDIAGHRNLRVPVGARCYDFHAPLAIRNVCVPLYTYLYFLLCIFVYVSFYFNVYIYIYINI